MNKFIYIIKLSLAAIIFTSLVYYIYPEFFISYCLYEDTAKELGKQVGKNMNPTVNINTKDLNINVPSNLLNNLGLGSTILGGMKFGAGAMKGGSPLAKAGFILGVAIAAGGVHIAFTAANKALGIPNSPYNNDQSKGGPYSAQSALDDNTFSIEALSDLFDGIIALRLFLIILVYTLLLFFITFVFMTKANLDIINKLSINNNIKTILIKIFKFLAKSNVAYFTVNWIVLLVSQIFTVYFLNLFIKNLGCICGEYAKLNNFDNISSMNSETSLFTDTNIIDYLASDLILQKINIFLSILVIHSFISILISKNKLNFDRVKNLPYGKNINLLLLKIFNDDSMFGIIMTIIIIIFMLIISIISVCYWYWFIHDFNYICYTYIKTL